MTEQSKFDQYKAKLERVLAKLEAREDRAPLNQLEYVTVLSAQALTLNALVNIELSIPEEHTMDMTVILKDRTLTADDQGGLVGPKVIVDAIAESIGSLKGVQKYATP